MFFQQKVGIKSCCLVSEGNTNGELSCVRLRAANTVQTLWKMLSWKRNWATTTWARGNLVRPVLL